LRDPKKEEEKTLLFYDYYVYLDPRRAQPTEQPLNKIEDKAKILPQNTKHVPHQKAERLQQGLIKFFGFWLYTKPKNSKMLATISIRNNNID